MSGEPLELEAAPLDPLPAVDEKPQVDDEPVETADDPPPPLRLVETDPGVHFVKLKPRRRDDWPL